MADNKKYETPAAELRALLAESIPSIDPLQLTEWDVTPYIPTAAPVLREVLIQKLDEAARPKK